MIIAEKSAYEEKKQKYVEVEFESIIFTSEDIVTNSDTVWGNTDPNAWQS